MIQPYEICTVGRANKTIRAGSGGNIIVETSVEGVCHNVVSIDTGDLAVQNILKSMGWKPPKLGRV